MKKHIFIMIRYSVLSENNTAWVIGRDNEFEAYKKELFSDERMSLHEELFFNVTLPSLQKMSPDKTTVFVFTSEALPDKNMQRLHLAQQKCPHIEIVPLSSKGGVVDKMQQHLQARLETFAGEVCYATVRLDDDDALADDFEQQMYHYISPEFEGHAITFANGYEGIYEKGGYSAFLPRHSPKIAMGLSLVQVFRPSSPPRLLSVYSLGSHTKVDEKHPLVINPLSPMYVRTIHPGSDIFAKQFKQKLEKRRAAKTVSQSTVAERFCFLREGSAVALETLPQLDFLGKGFASACLVTHHKSVLVYSHSSEQIHHCNPRDVVLDHDDELVCFDREKHALILSETGKQLFLDSRNVFSTNDSHGCKPLAFRRNGSGLAIVVKGAERYLSAERSGEVSFKKNCKAWEVFYLN